MTARRKDDGELEMVSWGNGTKAYRLVLLGAVLAATPIGQNILNSVGIKTPVASELAALSTELAVVKADIAAVKTDVGGVKNDVAKLKDDVKAVKEKSDKFEATFTGFQIDFDKFRKEAK